MEPCVHHVDKLKLSSFKLEFLCFLQLILPLLAFSFPGWRFFLQILSGVQFPILKENFSTLSFIWKEILALQALMVALVVCRKGCPTMMGALKSWPVSKMTKYIGTYVLSTRITTSSAIPSTLWIDSSASFTSLVVYNKSPNYKMWSYITFGIMLMLAPKS